MNDDLGGLPSRTVLSEGSLTPFCLPHCSPQPVAPQGLELAGAPRRVDEASMGGSGAYDDALDDCNTCVKRRSNRLQDCLRFDHELTIGVPLASPSDKSCLNLV